jgi:hypothetical protein
VSTVATAHSVIGRTYLERGRPVIVLIQWDARGGPRNVLIRRENGQFAVRPFRGPRKPPPAAPAAPDPS